MLHFNGSRFDWNYVGGNEWGFVQVCVASEDAVFALRRDGVFRFRGDQPANEWDVRNGDVPNGFYDWTSVWASSTNSAYIVGAQGGISHFDGTAWSSMPSGTEATLRDLWGSSETNVFAVGDDGTICRYDGSAWSLMPSGTTNSLKSAWGSSAEAVFAVGDNGTILFFDGAHWNTMASPTEKALTDIWGGSFGDVWAVGPGITLFGAAPTARST
jgi:hypothetical protein